jgi:hypothetical protein
MSEIDDQDAADAELELNPETLEDLEVVEGSDDPKGGLARGPSSKSGCVTDCDEAPC